MKWWLSLLIKSLVAEVESSEFTIIVNKESGNESADGLSEGDSVKGVSKEEVILVLSLFSFADQVEAGCVDTNHWEATDGTENIWVCDENCDNGTSFDDSRPCELSQPSVLPFSIITFFVHHQVDQSSGDGEDSGDGSNAILQVGKFTVVWHF